jgi:hypothetical protein
VVSLSPFVVSLSPFVVSLSNHGPPFDKLRANGNHMAGRPPQADRQALPSP